MTLFANSLVWFIIAVIAHIFVTKLRLILNISWIMTYSVFGVGFIGCVIVTLWMISSLPLLYPLPISSIALYASLSLSYMALTASPVLQDESPTTKILRTLLTKGYQTEKQLLSVLSEDEVIGKRINDSIQFGWLAKHNSRLVMTKRGKHIVKFLQFYRRILGISEGG